MSSRRRLPVSRAADATLAQMGKSEVKLPISIGLARLDLNGDGKADEPERLWRVLDSSLGGGNIPDEAAERFIITFDRADATWLRGYTHLLSALIEFSWRMTARPVSMPAPTCCFRTQAFPIPS